MSRVIFNQKYINGEPYACKTLKSFLWNKYRMSYKYYKELPYKIRESFRKEFERDYRIVYSSGKSDE